ncbi:MAG TPA: hypothetical protein VL308_11500 [Gemmatimonadaceae bacterium]|jgi:hypothetical protein|nr:hypothetical protein [Gemmatimonadaceae bacterium]
MRRTFLLVLALGLARPTHAQDSTIALPVRVHLLHSPASAALSTTRTESEVHTLLAVANQVWAVAGIRWELESVVREEALAGAQFDSLLAGQLELNVSRILAPIPRDSLLQPGWNVFLIRDFGRIAGGMFNPEISGVVLAERGFGYQLTPEYRGGRTLAHELGHSLGLGHVPCDSTRNVMANACSRPDAPSTLTVEQIARARTQAASKRPVSVMPQP